MDTKLNETKIKNEKDTKIKWDENKGTEKRQH